MECWEISSGSPSFLIEFSLSFLHLDLIHTILFLLFIFEIRILLSILSLISYFVGFNFIMNKVSSIKYPSCLQTHCKAGVQTDSLVFAEPFTPRPSPSFEEVSFRATHFLFPLPSSFHDFLKVLCRQHSSLPHSFAQDHSVLTHKELNSVRHRPLHVDVYEHAALAAHAADDLAVPR